MTMKAMEQQQFLSLPDQIVARLTEEIVEGVYAPGQRLKEQEIAIRLGTSRAPLREAFRILERNGLIEIRPWRGACVVEPTRDEIKELFEARTDMFGLCARHVAQEGDLDEIRQIDADINALIKETNKGCDERAYKRLTNDIAARMYAMIGNRHLRDFMYNLRAKMFWHYCYMGISTQKSRQDSNAHWRELADALLARDTQSAEAAAHNIMVASKLFALHLLDESAAQLSRKDGS